MIIKALYIQIIFFFLSLSCSTTLYSENIDKISITSSIDPIIIGIFPRRDPAITMRLFTPLAENLEKKLNHPIQLKTAANFKMFLRMLRERQFDVVHLNQYHYIQAHKELEYDLLVQNEEFGEANIRGAIYVHADSGIETIQQLRGKKILFGGGKSAMISYIVTTFLLRQEGLEMGSYKELFASSPPNAILSVYLRQVDASAAAEIGIRLPIVTNRIDTKKIKLLAVSEPLPHLAWAVKRELNDKLKQQLQVIMLAMKETEAGRKVLKQAHISAFNDANDEDYDIHRQIIKQVIINPKDKF